MKLWAHVVHTFLVSDCRIPYINFLTHGVKVRVRRAKSPLPHENNEPKVKLYPCEICRNLCYLRTNSYHILIYLIRHCNKVCDGTKLVHWIRGEDHRSCSFGYISWRKSTLSPLQLAFLLICEFSVSGREIRSNLQLYTRGNQMALLLCIMSVSTILIFATACSRGTLISLAS
jgi:hypothetical protein